ncbi:hypothetical protein GCM10022420_043110 [Streptomyces iranensis]|uniref:Ubiquinone/menaquinone biosynthesis C-methylase UbiE n=1 Tax=Streptomyces iranensis TaxID=576784 RepID=A0A060ZJE1_9ACTN|nr:hypothetical protein [Streptomyces iranensis]MBP2068590.1 ubiquinone/menaquinone biosynthesis C-methylase UbiE [Streptomyces iranensis]CDR01265.1 predicted protein [Streptomyces iranensis]
MSFVRAPAERLSEAGVRGPFDAVFAAYPFRNVTDPDAVLATVRALPLPGWQTLITDTFIARRAHDDREDA